MKYVVLRETDDGSQPVVRMEFDTLTEVKELLEKRAMEWGWAGYEVQYELFGFHVVAKDGTTVRYSIDVPLTDKEGVCKMNDSYDGIESVFVRLVDKWQSAASAHTEFVEQVNEIVYQHGLKGDHSDDLLFLEALDILPGDDRDHIIDEIREYMQSSWNDLISAETRDAGPLFDIMQLVSCFIDFTRLAEREHGMLVDLYLAGRQEVS